MTKLTFNPTSFLAVRTKWHTEKSPKALKCWVALPALVTFTLHHSGKSSPSLCTSEWWRAFSFIRVCWRQCSEKEFRNLISPPPFLFVFSPPKKRVISAASAVGRNFTVQFISYIAYKYKMTVQTHCASSLLYDTYLSAPSTPVFCLFPLPCLQVSKSVTASAMPKHFSRCGFPLHQLYPATLCIRGVRRGSHHPAHPAGGRDGEHINPEHTLGCTSPSEEKKTCQASCDLKLWSILISTGTQWQPRARAGVVNKAAS